MEVKQGCPISPILFGLCIDKYEEVSLCDVVVGGMSGSPIDRG